MNLLNLVPLPYRLAALAAAVAASALAVWGYGSHRFAAGHQAGYAVGHAEYVQLHDDMTSKALAAEADFRKREADMQARVTTAEESYAQLQTQHAHVLVAQRDLLAERGQLRQQIAAYAAGPAGGGGSAPDTAAAASERAAALGGLLAEALRADAESAAAAEGNADAVRTLLAAWPVNTAPP